MGARDTTLSLKCAYHREPFLKTHSVKLRLKAILPALKLKIASAKRGIAQERALQKGKAADPSAGTNRRSSAVRLRPCRSHRGKVSSNRYPRQDVYDLNWLISRNEIDDALQAQILVALVAKCQARQLEPIRASLDDPEIKERAGADWQSMKLERGEVPSFEGCLEFYRDLP